MKLRKSIVAAVLGFGLVHIAAYSSPAVTLPPPPGEGPALPDNLIDQADIASGALDLHEIRKAGGMVFTTPLNRYDGIGDGPPDVFDASRSFPFRGDRATLQTDMTVMLRVNGLDAQTCLECHSIVSSSERPMRLGIGGHGGINNSPIFGTGFLDVDDPDGNGIADTSGRVINPPFVFGAGGIELLAKEMTRDMQAIKANVESQPAGTVLGLETKGVYFGTVTSNGAGNPATVSIDNGLGVNDDLVVRPFGRKGEAFTIRDFDRGALAFHMGIQSVDVFGPGTDSDGDGISDELTIGEMSALSVFIATMPRPRTPDLHGDAGEGADIFEDIGCSSCHIPELTTESKYLGQSFPDVATDPDANVFMNIDLSKKPAKFEKVSHDGGLRVPLYADLKRHNLGAELAETTGSAFDPFFTTGRLWGIADSAPYMHDGRAGTLTEAILAHGGEAQQQRSNFEALSDANKIGLLTFLRSLKLPKQKDVDELRDLIKG